MATTTSTHALQFKSYKGGERRAEGQDGSVYSIKRIAEDMFETSVRMPGEKKFALLGGGGNGQAARMVADQHYTNPDQGSTETAAERTARHDAVTGLGGSLRKPSVVQEGSGTETVEQVLASIPDPEVEDVRKLVAATDDAVKASKQATAQAKRAAHTQAKAQATGPVLPLDFQPWRGNQDEHRAKGARHVYRVVAGEAGGFYAAQRQSGGFTPIAGKCHTFDEAAELATRYEKGAKQLSHRQFQGMPYALAIAQLDGEAK